MKAKEYFQIYLTRCDNGDKEEVVLFDIARDMILESKQLIEKRNCQTNEACLAVFYELEQKYKSYASLVNKKGGTQIRKDGLRAFIKAAMPDLWAGFVAAGVKGEK